MEQIGKKEGKVPLNKDIVSKCICDTCPVQGMSSCSKPKIQNMRNLRSVGLRKAKVSIIPSGMAMSLVSDSPEDAKVNSEDIAGPYCASGVASCRDLDQKKSCICPSCRVYSDYRLMNARPVEHFCFNDKAV